jgi:hypothetical protein
MTLLMCEGFETIPANNPGLVFTGYGTPPTDMTQYTGRFGRGKAWGRPGSNTTTSWWYLNGTVWGYSADTVGYIVGFAAKRTNWNNSFSVHSYMTSGSYTDAFQVRFIQDYIRVKMWNTDYPAYDVYLPEGTWAYVEWYYKRHSSTGRYHLKVNGNTIRDFTGDTRYSTGASHVGVTFRGDAWAGFQFDDLYFLAVDGSGLNDFLGKCRVDPALPNGAGNYGQFTPSAGSNYECVDDDPYSETDYVEADTDGDRDSYTIASVDSDIVDRRIKAIQLTPAIARTEDLANLDMTPFLRKSSVDYDGTLWNVPNTAYRIRRGLWTADPSDSNPWTKAKINACEIGVKLSKEVTTSTTSTSTTSTAA